MEENGKRLVVTGSSAGGIEALSTLLGSLSNDFPAPIVVAQHVDPRIESSLATILAKRTTLNVISIADHEALEPGTVYVVPANRHVAIEDGHVALVSDSKVRPKPSIDLLFATAAKAYGDRLIAVVLTGMGSDGAVGSRAVKEGGGAVIVEDPHTASFPSMPASLPSSLVDAVAPVEHIGEELERFLSETTIADEEDSLAFLLKRISATSGIDFSQYKMPTIKRRLARQMRSAGARSFEEYVSILDRTPMEYECLVANFLIKVTEFFRDPDLFEWLKDHAIPEIVKEASNGERELRFWSAGCATGEEAYSLAILVAEILGDEICSFNIRVFATDIDEGAVAFARRGVYPESALTNVPPEIVGRYFKFVDGMYEVGKVVRDMTVFGQHDLAQRAPFPRIDLVLCRNVLIYFNKELQRRTLQTFAFSLRTGGYLALGKAEMSNPLPASFEPANQSLHVFRRYGERVSIPPAPPMRPTRSSNEQRGRQRLTTHDIGSGGRKSDNEEVGMFLMDSAVGFVSINDRYDIAMINAAARQMLRIYGIAIGEDLIHLLPPESAARMRSVIDAALRSEQPQVGGEELQVAGEDEHDGRCLSISCYPKSSPKAGGAVGAALLIVDVTELVGARRSLEAEMQALRELVSDLRKREAQWQQNRQALLDANRQLLEANAGLRELNDTLLISSEEATAATEEIETLNEEMQATNEELETLNEESQASIEELNTTNDELEARTIELQELILARESQHQESTDSRGALQVLIDALPNAIAFVVSGGEIAASNREFRELRECAGESTVHIDDDSDAAIAFPVLLRRAANGESFRVSYQTIGLDQQRRRYRGTVTATKTDYISGALLVFERIE